LPAVPTRRSSDLDPEPKVPPDQRFNNIVGPIPQESLVDPSVGPIGVPAKVVPEADNVALWHHGQIKIITLSDQGRKFPGQTIQSVHVLLKDCFPIDPEDGIYM